MGYLEPQIYVDGNQREPNEFYIRNFNYPDDFTKSGSTAFCLLFDFPSDMDLKIGTNTFSGSIFDYFNPIIATPETVKKVKFLLGCEVLKTFTCSELVIPEVYLSRLRHFAGCEQRSFTYTPELSIKYPSMEVLSERKYQNQILDLLQVPVNPTISMFDLQHLAEYVWSGLSIYVCRF